MKKIFKRAVAGLLVSSFAFASVGLSSITVEAKATQHISQIIAFGDSASDNGQAYEISKAILETPDHYEGAYLKPGEGLYWENRYSNGKTAVEILAEKLDVSLTNYAVGGATTGYENYSDWMDSLGYTGVLGQVDKFKASLDGEEADSEALYFIFAGGNDYCKFLDYGLEGTLEGTAQKVIDNTVEAITELAELGAEKFFVPNSNDLTKGPFEITMGRQKEAAIFRDYVNKNLPKALKDLEKQLKIDITQFDVTKATQNIIKHADQYGLVYLDVECQPTYPEIKPAKENPDQYMFWDEWHPSRVTHWLLGDAMYQIAKKIK